MHHRPDRELRPLAPLPVSWVFVLAFLIGVGLEALLPPAVKSPAAESALTVAGGFLFCGGGACGLGPLHFSACRHHQGSWRTVPPAGHRRPLSVDAEPQVRWTHPRVPGRSGPHSAGLAAGPPAPHARIRALVRDSDRGRGAGKGVRGGVPRVPSSRRAVGVRIPHWRARTRVGRATGASAPAPHPQRRLWDETGSLP